MRLSFSLVNVRTQYGGYKIQIIKNKDSYQSLYSFMPSFNYGRLME